MPRKIWSQRILDSHSGLTSLVVGVVVGFVVGVGLGTGILSFFYDAKKK
jgi:hypothetical protein